jgi:hypothetical protein
LLFTDTGFHRAYIRANAAVRAQLRVDGILRVALLDGIDRAFVLAGSTHDAVRRNPVGHRFFSLFYKGVQIFDNHAGVFLVHESGKQQGFPPGTGAVETIFPEMFQENFPRLRVFFEDLPDVHLLVDLWFPHRHFLGPPLNFFERFLLPYQDGCLKK